MMVITVGSRSCNSSTSFWIFAWSSVPTTKAFSTATNPSRFASEMALSRYLILRDINFLSLDSNLLLLGCQLNSDAGNGAPAYAAIFLGFVFLLLIDVVAPFRQPLQERDLRRKQTVHL